MAIQRQEDQDRQEEQRENKQQQQAYNIEWSLHKESMENTHYQTMQSMMMMAMTKKVNLYKNSMYAAQRMNNLNKMMMWQEMNNNLSQHYHGTSSL